MTYSYPCSSTTINRRDSRIMTMSAEAAPQFATYWTVLAALVPGSLALITLWFKESKKDARDARSEFSSQRDMYDKDRRSWELERIQLHTDVGELRGRLSAYEREKENWQRTESEMRQQLASLRGELAAYERYGLYEKKPGGNRRDDPT